MAYFFRQVCPLLPVGHAAVQEWLDPGKGLGQAGVQWPADQVDKLHLHLRQFVFALSVHHGLSCHRRQKKKKEIEEKKSQI